jgi:hypothetical protein
VFELYSKSTVIEVEGLLKQWWCMYPCSTTVDMCIHAPPLLEGSGIVDLVLLYLLFALIIVVKLNAARGMRFEYLKL